MCLVVTIGSTYMEMREWIFLFSLWFCSENIEIELFLISQEHTRKAAKLVLKK